MRIQAKLNPASHIHKSWRLQARIGGTLNGVYFKLRTNREYVSDEVPPHLLAGLNGHRHVQLEMMSEPMVIDIKVEPEVSPFVQPIIPLPSPQEDVAPIEDAASSMDEVAAIEEQTPKKRGRPAKAV